MKVSGKKVSGVKGVWCKRVPGVKIVCCKNCLVMFGVTKV